jgi:hypothetical protein
MNSIGNFEKKIVISVVSEAKSLPLHMCFALFYSDFCMDFYSIDSDEALNASLLQFFISIKCFIAITFYGKTSFHASSQLLFNRNSPLNASSLLLFKVTLPTSPHRAESLEEVSLLFEAGHHVEEVAQGR